MSVLCTSAVARLYAAFTNVGQHDRLYTGTKRLRYRMLQHDGVIKDGATGGAHDEVSPAACCPARAARERAVLFSSAR